MLYELIRPPLFGINPEMAHLAAINTLQNLSRLGLLNPLKRSSKGCAKTVMGLDFPNPVGLAAGFDKNGECIDGLAALGFGFIEIGTVTPRPQSGNPIPRLFRLPEAEAIINRLGFNSKGLDCLVDNVKASHFDGVLGINIGKNKETSLENALDDYLTALRKVYELASYVTVNISSPNTPGLRTLQTGEHLEELIAGIVRERDELQKQHERRVPLTVKIAPDLSVSELEQIADSLVRYGIDGIIATNTTSSRAGVEGMKHAEESGGLSGRPLTEKSTEVVKQLAEILQGKIPIIAAGGIMTADDAKRKLDAGAELVQIYTGFIYHGPGLVSRIRRATKGQVKST